MTSICLFYSDLGWVGMLLAGLNECRESCFTECLTILDTAASGFQLKIKEAMCITLEKPILNQQVKHVNLSLSM